MKDLTMKEMMTIDGGHSGYAEQPGNQELNDTDTAIIKNVTLVAISTAPYVGPAVVVAAGTANDMY